MKRYEDVAPCGTVGTRLLTPLSDSVVAAFSRSVTNLEAGFKERVLYIDEKGTLPPACRADLGELAGFLDRVAQHVGPCKPCTVTDYVMSKRGSKRNLYAAAAKSLVHRPATLGQLSSLSFFVKREATLWTKRQVPRVISPRTPEFNILLGRFLQPVEHRIFDALQQACGSPSPVVAKGLTQEAKASIIVDKLAAYGCCVGLDASRFDQSIGCHLLNLEHSLYTRLFPGSRTLRYLLQQQLAVAGVGRCPDGFIRYRGPAMRCSGDVNTSLGNCIISVVLAHAFLADHGIAGDIFCDGDDCLLFVPPASLHLLRNLSAWYLGFGLRMKVEEPAFEPERVEFCQSRPVHTGSRWVLCRSPAKAFNTDGFVPFELSVRDARVHLRSVGLCGLSMAAGLPLFDSFYSGMVKHGITGRFDTALLGGLGMQHAIEVRGGRHASSSPVTPECRMSFWRAFGISPEEQIAFERLLDSMDMSQHVVASDRRQLSGHDPRDHLLNYFPDRTDSVVNSWCC